MEVERLNPYQPTDADLAAAARADDRPTLPEPPPVRVVALRDVVLPAVAGLHDKLAGFYIGLLRFRRSSDDPLSFEAENVTLRFNLVVDFPLERDHTRPLGVQVPHYHEVLEHLEASKSDFEVVRGLVAGNDAILLRDPAGNWIAVGELREVR